MEHLTTFTGKSGRLLRGTASRLWGVMPGTAGALRQIHFQDLLHEGEPKLAPPLGRGPRWLRGGGLLERRRAGGLAWGSSGGVRAAPVSWHSPGSPLDVWGGERRR